jgi:UDP-2,4-diacetamido-2,4,6-trideoxy-beta-L-altropyranose hydrolase
VNVVFRADASLTIGTGHIMRCLSLAEGLREKGAKCFFVTREHRGNLIALIRDKGFEVIPLSPEQVSNNRDGLVDVGSTSVNPYSDWLGISWQEDAAQTILGISALHPDWLIVDHYSIDHNWETLIRPHCKEILVIDDLANRRHDCDILLDQNLSHTSEQYLNLVPPDCRLLIGPKYALLRTEFSALRENSLRRRERPQLTKLLVSMGGVDSNNLTGEILSALNECDLPQDLEITVVVGQNFPWMSQIHEQASKMPRPTKVFVNVSNIAQLMVESDLAIGAAGATTWERCCLGLPSLVLSLAANQQGVANNLDNLGISHLLKLGSSLAKELKWQIESIMESPAILRVMTEKSRQITDGLGIERVMREFYTVSINTLEVEDE